MNAIKEWLSTAKKDYEEARRLMDEESLKDPITEPYKSRYKAANILDAMKQQLNELSDGYSEENPLNPATLINILIKIDLGINAIETEEMSLGEKYLNSALTLLEEQFDENPSLVLHKCIALNQLGFLWSSRGEYDKAVQLLLKAENLYFSWSKIAEKESITLSLLDAFNVNPLQNCGKEAVNVVERTHTQTLYFLAQVYEKLGNNKAADYCRRTLQRQYDSKEYNGIEWALHAATLSQCFATKNDFKTARHLIACARFVLNNHNSNEDDDEELKRANADLARICVKYSLILLEASHTQTNTINECSSNGFERMLTEEAVNAIEKSMVAKLVVNFDEARTVFLQAQNWITEAKEYYALDEHASDYVECVQDTSKLYRLLTLFESNPERRFKMHKRRVNLYEDLLKEINPEYFLAQSRQMQFELGETFSEMIDIQIIATNNMSGDQLVTAAKKINALIYKAIKYFTGFIDSFRDKLNSELPSTFSDEMVKPILVAFFSIGRLHSKVYTPDSRNQATNWKLCEEQYKKVVDYIDRNPQHKEYVSEEFALVEEMLQLIPGKLNLLLNSRMY